MKNQDTGEQEMTGLRRATIATLNDLETVNQNDKDLLIQLYADDSDFRFMHFVADLARTEKGSK